MSTSSTDAVPAVNSMSLPSPVFSPQTLLQQGTLLGTNEHKRRPKVAPESFSDLVSNNVEEHCTGDDEDLEEARKLLR